MGLNSSVASISWIEVAIVNTVWYELNMRCQAVIAIA